MARFQSELPTGGAIGNMGRMDAEPSFPVQIGLVVAFPAFWCGVLAWLAWLGGWSVLAERFRAGPLDSDPATSRHPLSRLIVRRAGWLPVRYKTVVTVTITPLGIHLSLAFPFRFMHPPLFIPWAEIASIRPSTELWFDTQTVRLAHVPIEIQFFEPASRDIVRHVSAAPPVL